jgi:hypothetical protein
MALCGNDTSIVITVSGVSGDYADAIKSIDLNANMQTMGNVSWYLKKNQYYDGVKTMDGTVTTYEPIFGVGSFIKINYNTIGSIIIGNFVVKDVKIGVDVKNIVKYDYSVLSIGDVAVFKM